MYYILILIIATGINYLRVGNAFIKRTLDVFERDITLTAIVFVIVVAITSLGDWLISHTGFAQHVANLITQQHRFLEAVFICVTIFLFKVFPVVISEFKRSELAKRVGLFFYVPNSDDSERLKCSSFLAENATEADYINVACATGYNSFSSPDAPLRKALTTCKHVRILMICPYSVEVEARSNKLKKALPPGEYIDHIKTSIQYLESLFGTCKIELRMYDRYPFWRITQTDKLAFIQQYPERKRVQDAPFYAFSDDSQSKYGFHGLVEALFDRLWDKSTNGEYNFESKMLKFKTGPLVSLSDL